MILLFAIGCSRIMPWPVDDDPQPGDERIAVSPARIDFGAVSVNLQGDATRSLTVYNLGDVAVTITGQDEPIGDEDAFRVDALPVLTLEPGEQRSLEVSFLPRTEAESLARLRFEPGSEVVELLGAGRAPVLHTLDPELPATVLGCSGQGTVVVENLGSEALSFEPTVSGDDFALVGWEGDVAPGERATVTLAFTPSAGGERSGQLTLSTNDPLRPQAAVALAALGYEGAHVRETFVYAPSPPTDVVFAVQGGVFAGDARLTDAIDAYADHMVAAQVDLRLSSVPSAGPCALRAPLWAELGDSALRIGTVIEHGFDGAGGPWDEDLVGLVENILWHAESGGCLDGFRRDAAALDVVLVAEAAPAADPVADWEALRASLPEELATRVSVLVADGDACTGAEAYLPLASATDGAVGNLCGASWTAAFTAFAALPASVREMRYPLAETPVAGTVQVRADGAPYADWTWDAADNAVVVGADTHPDFGAELEIEYVSAVSCGQ